MCFLCKQNFNNVKLLLKHLFVVHACNKDTVYVCPVKLCEQNFQSVHAYKKHLEKHKLAREESFFEQINEVAKCEKRLLVSKSKENV